MKKLSAREIQIIKYTAKGYTAKKIAKIIGLGHRTIEIYISNMRRKLGAKNIANAIYIASLQNILGDVS
jgi:DNA-binding CsgD family transcriptional regulator